MNLGPAGRLRGRHHRHPGDRCSSTGLIKKLRDGVKVLGNGDLTKALTVRAHKFSAKARSRSRRPGGKAEVLRPR